MEKVIPQALNYADIKPEAIENQVRLVKFTPVSTITNGGPSDIIRFHLFGTGFFDPYSAYIKFTVTIPCLQSAATAAENDVPKFGGKFLDRSAHSFINRLVIRSQGTELERIEQYDVMAAMVNDMIYSSEQRAVHHAEGFATQQLITHPAGVFGTGDSHLVASVAGEGEAIDAHIMQSTNIPSICGSVGEPGSYWIKNAANAAAAGTITAWPHVGAMLCKDMGLVNGVPITIISQRGENQDLSRQYGDQIYQFGGTNLFNLAEDANVRTISQYNGAVYQSEQTFTFTIPIYSGIIGVLMPYKKMIPMSLLPLEVEFTLNPHALYPAGAETDRSYTISKFEIFAHTLFFEQELHRSLESIVAEHGIFIHYNSFYLGPVAQLTPRGAAAGLLGQNLTNPALVRSAIQQYSQINVYAKSINSVHFVFLYGGYEQANGSRKLNFVSHNLTQLQLRNGTELTPSEPIVGQVGTSTNYGHVQFLIETYKAWGRMHDPSVDSGLTAYNYNSDMYFTKPITTAATLLQQAKLGRCQYAISLEGEELGQDKAIITGRKGLMPFDINFQGSVIGPQQSYQLIFIRADFIVYVRPDLVVTRLGM